MFWWVISLHTSRKVVTVYRRPLPGATGPVLRDIPAAPAARNALFGRLAIISREFLADCPANPLVATAIVA